MHVLGDPLPHRNAADADMPAALFWLEIFARLGFLRRNDQWTKLYERLIDDCDSGGVWHPPKRTATMRSDNAYAWPGFPLELQATAEERWSDITFRLGVIARHSGRPIQPHVAPAAATGLAFYRNPQKGHRHPAFSGARAVCPRSGAGKVEHHRSLYRIRTPLGFTSGAWSGKRWHERASRSFAARRPHRTRDGLAAPAPSSRAF